MSATQIPTPFTAEHVIVVMRELGIEKRRNVFTELVNLRRVLKAVGEHPPSHA